MKNINSKTKLLALIGDPVDHSLSPKIHNTAFEKLGLNYVYLSLGVKEGSLERAVAGMRVIGARGFNVTMPHKENILQYLDEISLEAQLIGSVNTVLVDNGRLIGYNTDGKGYVQSLLDNGIDIKNKKILMVGAGGATKSVAIQLAVDGARQVALMNRTLKKAMAICNTISRNISTFEVKALELEDNILKKELMEADILINCTPLGMHPNEDKCIITNPEMLHPSLIVSDLIYEPKETILLKIAKERGCKTINGLGMLLWQGALAFKIWTQREMPVDYVKKEIFSVD